MSAEMYCSNDVLNYDNFDFINPVEAGHTYYCVGFNSPIRHGGGEPTESNETIVIKAADLAANIGAVISDRTKWFFYNDNTDAIDNGLGSFVTGPASAPIGTGSADIILDATNNRTDIATYAFSSTTLANIKTLKFSAYSHSGVAGASESPYLVFNVSFDGADTWQKRLVYVPSNNGAVPQDTWNTYDTIDGGNGMWVYSGTTWPGTVTPGTTPRSWSNLLASYPNISVRKTDSFMGVRVGEPGPTAYEGNIDKFVIGVQTGSNLDTKTFDFEPTPAVVDMCSNIQGTQETVPEGMTVNDGVCTTPEVVTPTVTAPTSTGGGRSGGRSHGGGGGSVLGAFTTGGQVLGESCGLYMEKYLRLGSKKNDADQTKKLQTFLNKWMKTTLPITGTYGPATEKGVKAFQSKYSDDILTPWNVGAPTGLVYFTTLHKINELECPEAAGEKPSNLIDWSKNKNVQ